MNKQKIILSSLAMDLNRVALGLYRGSDMMAHRFFKEALARKSEINPKNLPSYIRDILSKLESKRNIDKSFAEDALMYSILLENFTLKGL